MDLDQPDDAAELEDERLRSLNLAKAQDQVEPEN